ncbi:MAG: CARDB domain-containing protein [Planctomycetota bacterium]
MNFSSLWRGIINGGQHCSRRNRSQASSLAGHWSESIELCEARVVPAAVGDLSAGYVASAMSASPGSQVTVDLRVDNLAASASRGFQIEIRLSQDDVIDGQDLLLAKINGRKLGANSSFEWSKKVKLPDNLAGGTYHIGIVVDPANRIVESNESNNALADHQTISIFRDELVGRVKAKGGAKSVEIHAVGDGASAIDPDLTTWVVIHGRNQSSTSTNIAVLAQQIDGYQTGDQVLVLDWSQAAASGTLGGQGENYIQPVAQWAFRALHDYGFSGTSLNLVGYSWGAEVAAEMAENFGQVNSIMAIDPARDYPGGTYNPESPGEVDYQAHAAHSWAFYASTSLPFGSPIPASSAEYSFVLTGSDHFGVVSVVTSILSLPAGNAVAAELPLAALLTGMPIPSWQLDSYSSAGVLNGGTGPFDAVLTATPDGNSIATLRYFNGVTEQTVDAIA